MPCIATIGSRRFPAVRLDGRLLVDGGVLDPVPVETARSLAPGLPVVTGALPGSGWVERAG